MALSLDILKTIKENTTGIEITDDRLHELRSWYDARDVFFGVNYTKRDRVKGLEMASKCTHEDAVWLCSVYRKEDAIKPLDFASLVFASQPRDRRSICFLACHGFVHCVDLLLESASIGYTFAQNELLRRGCGGIPIDTRNRYIENAASAWEPHAMYMLYKHALYTKNLEKSRVCLQFAALLGSATAIHKHVVDTFDDTDPNAYTILGDLLCRGRKKNVTFRLFFDYIDLYRCGKVEYSEATYEIGKSLCSYGQVESWFVEEIYIRTGHQISKERVKSSFDFAVDFYNGQHRLVCDAIHTWSLIGRRFKVVKDIRIMIGKMIWADRRRVTDKKVIRILNRDVKRQKKK